MFDTATIKATPITASLPLYAAANVSAADKDQVNLTTAAAFNVTKAISAPAVAWSANGGTWPVASTSGPRSASASCAATVGGATTVVPGCVYTTYTINFSNTGGAAGKFALSDTLPTGLTYVPGSAVWSNAPGVALTDATTGETASGIDFGITGGAINAVVTSLGTSVSQSISFVVLVNNTAAIGTSTTTNTANYNASDSATATSAAIGTVAAASNPAAFTVTASFAIAIGTGGSTFATAKDTTPGSANGSADLTTQPSVSPGGSVAFTQTVFNNGNASDTINLTAANVNFPAGTTFAFFAADGVTPLLDTTGDGVVDTGPIAATGSVNIVVRANVPSSATGTGTFTATITAKSASDATLVDATTDAVTALVAPSSLIDLTNSAAGTGMGNVGNGDLGAGPSPQPTTTLSTAAGSSAVFTLFIKNNDSVANNYNLIASQTNSFPGSLPSGWTVKYVASGTVAAGCAAATAVAQPIALAVAEQKQVVACVTPPAAQLPVTAQSIYFRVTSTGNASTGGIVIDTKQDAVTVTAAMTFGATLSPNNSGQVAPGGQVVYAHTLTSTGAQACGAYTVAAAPTNTAAGWATALYLDNNGDGQLDGDPLYTGATLTLSAGGVQKFLVKVFAPGGAVSGDSDLATVTVTFSANCGTPSATDLSTVVTGQIRMTKSQAADANCDGIADTALSAAPLSLKPGQCIVYSMTATNQGTSPLTNLSINDAVPPSTTLAPSQPATPATQCTSTGITGTALVYASSATAISCGSSGNIVAPGGTATLTFAVKINS